MGIASLFVLSGCGGSDGGVGSIEDADGDRIENAEEFLTEATSEWEETVPSENVEVSEDSGCFFVIDEDDAATGDLACGGVRTTTAEDGEVWDLGEFEVRENSDNEMNAQTSDNWTSQLQRSQPRPDMTLVDGEGDAAPEGIDELAAPPMPQLDSGLTLSGESLPEDLVQPDDEEISPGDAGEVVTPAGTMQLQSVATLETVPVRTGDTPGSDGTGSSGSGSSGNNGSGGGTSGQNQDESDIDTDDGDVTLDPDGEPHAPAEGETLMLLDYEFTPAEGGSSGWGQDDSDDYSAALALNDGSSQRTIAQFEQGGSGFGSSSSAESGRLLVSVPEDDASLVVSASGEDQVIDLPAGERADNEVTRGYYRDVTQQDENHEFDIADQEITIDDDEREISFYLNLQQAGLTAFSEDGGADGWADPGMAWLTLEFDAVLEVDSYVPRFLDYDPSVEVTADDGETYSASRSIEVETSTWNETYAMAVHVPADAQELTVTQSMESRVEQNDDIVSLDFAAEAYTVEFPDEGSDDGSEGQDSNDDDSEDES